MGTPNDQTAIKVLGALALLILLVGVGVPGMLYLALGTMTAVYVWYAVVFTGVSMGLLAYLLEDHDKPPPTIRRIGGRIT